MECARSNADDASRTMRRAHEPRDIERLPRAELHAGPQHQRDLAPCLLEQASMASSGNEVFARRRRELDQAVARIEPMPRNLRRHGMPIRRERAGLDENLRARAGGPIEAREHHVDVHRERIHRDHFARARAREY